MRLTTQVKDDVETTRVMDDYEEELPHQVQLTNVLSEMSLYPSGSEWYDHRPNPQDHQNLGIDDDQRSNGHATGKNRMVRRG